MLEAHLSYTKSCHEDIISGTVGLMLATLPPDVAIISAEKEVIRTNKLNYSARRTSENGDKEHTLKIGSEYEN